MWTSFTPAVQQMLDLARGIAIEAESSTVEPLHVLLGLTELTPEQAPALHILLEAHEINTTQLRLYTEAAIVLPHRRSHRAPRLSAAVNEALSLATEAAQQHKQWSIGPEYVLLGLARVGTGVHYQAVMYPLGLTPRPLQRSIEWLEQNRRPHREGNPLNDLSEASKQVVERAHEIMRSSFCGRIDSPHLLSSLLDEESLAETFKTAEIDTAELKRRLREGVTSDGEIAMPQQRFTDNAKRVFEWAAGYAHEANAAEISPTHLLRALLPVDLGSEEIHALAAGENLIARSITREQAAALENQLKPVPHPILPEVMETADIELQNPRWVRLMWPYFLIGSIWGPIGYVALRQHWDFLWLPLLTGFLMLALASLVAALLPALRRWNHHIGSVVYGCLAGTAFFLFCIFFIGVPL